MKNIQKDWKEIGFVPRKFSNELWEEFRSLCNLFFERLKSGYQKINEEEEKSLKKKDKFIKGIEKLEIPLRPKPLNLFLMVFGRNTIFLGRYLAIPTPKTLNHLKRNSFP